MLDLDPNTIEDEKLSKLSKYMKIVEQDKNHEYSDSFNFDLITAMISLTKGEFESFKEIVKRLEQEDVAQSSDSNLWIKLFSLLAEYIDVPNSEAFKEEIDQLKNESRRKSKNYFVDHIDKYQRLLVTKDLIDKSSDRFDHITFQDLYKRNNSDDSDEYSPTPIQKNSGDPPDSPASMPRRLKSNKREEDEL